MNRMFFVLIAIAALASCGTTKRGYECYERPATKIRHGMYVCNCIDKTVYIKHGNVDQIIMEACLIGTEVN